MAGGGGGGGGGCAWTRRGAARARSLRTLLRDTQRALADVTDILAVDPELVATVHRVSQLSSRRTLLVLMGTSTSATVRLLHSILGQKLLPDSIPRGRRWIRVHYGTSTQVHLSLGNSEFELVEELECSRRPWDTIPLEDILRTDESDLTTILEVEITNQFLKDGLCIVLPPDIPDEPDHSINLQDLKQRHADFNAKRNLIFKSFNPVYLYALDRIGKNMFTDNFCDRKMVLSKSDEDFWATFNLYHMTGSMKRKESEVVQRESVLAVEKRERDDQPYVFNAENCLDLHQIKELNANAQIFFVLFSDSVDVTERERHMLEGDGDREFSEATESTEDYRTEELPESDQSLVLRRRMMDLEKSSASDKRRSYEERSALMNDLLEQWELTSAPPSKHTVKTQYLIIDDEQISRSDQRMTTNPSQSSIKGKGKREDDKVTKSRTVLLSKIVKFASDTFQCYLLEYASKLSEVHVKLLQQFILSSFDLARELQVVPKKIQYVARQEQQLYETMTEKFSEGDKKQELLQIMQEVLQEMKVEVNNMDWSVDDLPCHRDERFIMSNSVFYASSPVNSDTTILSEQNNSRHAISNRIVTKLITESSVNSLESEKIETQVKESEVEEAVSYDSFNFEEFDIIDCNEESFCDSDAFQRKGDGTNLDQTTSESRIGQIRVENESPVLSVNRSSTLLSDPDTSTCVYKNQISVKQATLDVQKNVLNKLSKRISFKLTKFVDSLKDSYYGTLQRCLSSLEADAGSGGSGSGSASAAMRSLVSAARGVQVEPGAACSLLLTLLHSLRRLFHRVRMSGVGVGAGDGPSPAGCCALSGAWRRRTALRTLHELSAPRLARIISHQLLENLKSAHEKYQAALGSLESGLASRLHHSEDVKLAIRKKYAPSFARLCLESTSMCDVLMYGIPELGREIGRGQYGVVYSCRAWGGRPAAVKSVLPADARHYRDLAMEFFYTRSIPPHPRIVRLYGSVVCGGGGGGGGGGALSVWLVSARRARDLHAAVRAGLTAPAAARVALDVVHGIRYLHSLGLVHRDIKMKNVLLDQNDRAALTDLGFCSAETLMSGSVVGTPVHMAPELLGGDYHSAVDVYAFAILYWYLCAGSVKLPGNFEAFQNKEQLWSKVRKGLRPERLPHFSDASWDIMQSCWASEPAQRALLGDVQPKLELLLEQAIRNEHTAIEQTSMWGHSNHSTEDYNSDDSIYMTGINKHLL